MHLARHGPLKDVVDAPPEWFNHEAALRGLSYQRINSGRGHGHNQPCNPNTLIFKSDYLWTAFIPNEAP